MSTTTLTRASALEREQAAERRRAAALTNGYMTQDERQAARAAGGPGAPSSFRAPGSQARSVGFPAVMRAKKTTYNDQDLYHLNGIASVVELGYEMWDWAGPYTEIVDARAFDKTLSAGPDTVFLTNHRGLTMARTIPVAGRKATLLLGMVAGDEAEENGLGSDAYVNPKRSDVSDLVTAVDDGVVDEMSFAFMLNEGWWSQDFETFRITEVDIDRGDVSAVNYGANPYTSIAARQREILQELRGLPLGAARAAFGMLARRDDIDIDTLYHAYSQSLAMDVAGTSAAATVAPAVVKPATPSATGRSLSYYEALIEEDERSYRIRPGV